MGILANAFSGQHVWACTPQLVLVLILQSKPFLVNCQIERG